MDLEQEQEQEQEQEPNSKRIKIEKYNSYTLSHLYKIQNVDMIKEYINTLNINDILDNQHNIISLFIKENDTYSYNDLITIIDFFIGKGINLKMLNNFGFTPLIVCINNKFIKLAKILIEKEIGINTETHLLFEAIIYKNLYEILKLILEKGINPNTLHYDMTPLMIASYHRRYDMVQLLLEFKTDINYLNNNCENALFFACNSSYNNTKPNFEIINSLIKHKININTKNNNGETPLFYATKLINKHNHLTIITLLEAGADPNLTDIYGNNPLITLINDNINESILILIPIMMTLINAGTNVNHKNNKGYSIFDIMDNEMFQYYQLCSNYNYNVPRINNKIYISKECLICFETNSKMVLFDKCNHSVLCFKCFQNLINHHNNQIDIKCPYCNMNISTHTIIESL
jgi:ankyrin repeat protein